MNFNYNENFLYFYSKLLKSYKSFSTNGLKDFNLTPIEIEILKFLINNGKYFKTARDISTYKGVSKALVSKGVNSLIESGYIISKKDDEDKRISNLYITDKAQPIIERLNLVNIEFYEILSKDISKKDLEILKDVHIKMLKNIEKN